jgi:tetratricopeptide (TPR) repeat protein
LSSRSPENELHRLLERFEAQPTGRLFAPLADCYRKLGRLDEAYKLCVDGLVRHARYSTGFVVLGKIHLDRGEADEARTAFETVLSIDPENLIALHELSRDARERGELKRAEGFERQLHTLDPAAESPDEEANAPHPEERPEADEPEAEESEADEAAVLQARDETSDTEADEPTKPIVLTALSRDDAMQGTSSEFDPEGIFTGETIATVTLADVYYQQGFKAKALEMYQRVLARHPRAPGVREKILAIESEMSQLAERFQEIGQGPAEGELEKLEREGETTQPEIPVDPDLDAFRTWIKSHEKPES